MESSQQNENLAKHLLNILSLQKNSVGEVSEEFAQELNLVLDKLGPDTDPDHFGSIFSRELRLRLQAESVSIMVMNVVDSEFQPSSLVLSNYDSSREDVHILVPSFLRADTSEDYQEFLKTVFEAPRIVEKEWKTPISAFGIESNGLSLGISVHSEVGSHWILDVNFCSSAMPSSEKREHIKEIFEAWVRIGVLLLQRIQSNLEQKEFDRRMDAFIQSMPSAMVGMDFLGAITIWSGKAEEFFGFAAAEVMGRYLADIIPEFSFVAKHIVEALDRNEGLVFEPVKVKSGGVVKFFQPHLYHLLDSPRGEIGLRIDDVSERENILRQAELANQHGNLGLLAGGLAHDFNNILSSISATSSLLARKLKRNALKEELSADIIRIQESVQRAESLVNSLLTLGKDTEEIESFDLLESLDSVIVLAKESFPIGVNIELEALKDGVVLRGNKLEFENAILNLLINGQEAMNGQGDLRLSYKLKFDPQDTMVKILVRDFGKGLSEEAQSQIFKPFYSSKKTSAGGMGLVMVRRMVESMGGMIGVNSKEPGSEFCLQLPVHQIIPQRKVLVIEDDMLVGQSIEGVMNELGYICVLAKDGPSGVEAFTKSKDFDLVILDLNLPGMHGSDVFRVIRQVMKQQAVLFCTDKTSAGSLGDILQLDGVGLLKKPFSIEELEEKAVFLNNFENSLDGSG